MEYKRICLLFLFHIYATSATIKLTEERLKYYLENIYEIDASAACYRQTTSLFDVVTDIGNKTKEQTYLNITLENAKFFKETWNQYFKGLNVNDYQDPIIRRQVKFLPIIGSAALDPKELEKLTNVRSKMVEIYSAAKICPYKKPNCNLSTEGMNLEPGIENIMTNSEDYDELLYVWVAWRNATGAKIKDVYDVYVNLSNEVAHVNNFKDYGEFWRFGYEDSNFIETIDNLWKQVEPLYNELHKYVSRLLKERMGDKLDISDGLLPAHVLGNMWAQQWNNLKIPKPFPNASQINGDKALKDAGYDILDMFKTADEFYQSLGLLPNGMCYNESLGAMIRKPTDGREVLCHASAWDFCDKKTFRLKMCTKLTFEDFVTIHHEMGHIQYFQQYKDQLYTLRDGANPGFHEAVGDTMALAVTTPKHLKKIGLVKDFEDTKESQLNSLMDMAMDKIAFLPFGLLVDKWRWDVFSGSVPKEKWNSHWWYYRGTYQKMKPPVPRSDLTDLDPAAKFHVAGDSQYIAYFISYMLQFQFYRSLCIAAGEYDPANKTQPLHSCDFYQSKKAGDLLRSGLSLGSSKHWSEVLKIMTGENNISASAILEYFEPLYNFLREENEREANVSQSTSDEGSNSSNETNDECDEGISDQDNGSTEDEDQSLNEK